VGALKAFALLNAKKLLPIHWSTFELGLHAWSEPAETLTLEAQKRGVDLVTPHLGESVEPLVAVTGPWWRDSPPTTTNCPR
jgi:L-ascorbate metabolism protein UlaG (beta-lactamase superfamily)